MKEQLAQVNRTVVALVLVLVIGGGGFVWWQFMYKPAVASRDTAQMTASAAQATLADARGRLTNAQQQVDEAKKANGGKLDESIARLQLAQEAITPKAAIDDAAVLLSKYADRSGISTVLEMDVPEGTNTPTGSTATPLTVKMRAAGTYLELQHFISLVEGSVEVKRGAMHVRGRLFNVVAIEMRPPEDIQMGTDDSSSSSGTGTEGASALKVGKDDIIYDIQIRMYLSAFGGDAATTSTPGATPDAAGATGTGTPGSTGTTTPTPGATGTSTSTTPGTGTPAPGTPATGTPTTGTPGTTATPGATTGTGTATPTAGATG